MSYLNANIPPIYCKIRREYLYDLKKHKGEASDCVVFGLSSISGRALLFHCMLHIGCHSYVHWRCMREMSGMKKADSGVCWGSI